MTDNRLRVLVVDDSALYRKIVRDLLAADPRLEVVGTAFDGRKALEAIRQLEPDLITLDVEMPVLDGLGVLAELKTLARPPAVLMLSALTMEGARATTLALRLGAFDFVLKPNGLSPEESVRQLRGELGPRIDSLWAKRASGTTPPPAAVATPAAVSATPRPGGRPELVAVGISTGGPAALAQVVPQLPADFPVPIALVQHMPPVFTKSLADDLNRSAKLHVSEAAAGDRLEPGRLLIAPGGKHMRVIRDAAGLAVEITDDPPERSCRPSVDYLFRSISHVCGGRAVAAVMTGMGDDGTLGARLLARQGATIVVQDAASCVVHGMPRMVVEAGVPHQVCPLAEFAERLTLLARRPALACR